MCFIFQNGTAKTYYVRMSTYTLFRQISTEEVWCMEPAIHVAPCVPACGTSPGNDNRIEVDPLELHHVVKQRLFQLRPTPSASTNPKNVRQNFLESEHTPAGGSHPASHSYCTAFLARENICTRTPTPTSQFHPIPDHHPVSTPTPHPHPTPPTLLSSPTVACRDGSLNARHKKLREHAAIIHSCSRLQPLGGTSRLLTLHSRCIPRPSCTP